MSLLQQALKSGVSHMTEEDRRAAFTTYAFITMLELNYRHQTMTN
jgi:hypothetical protein